MRSLEEIERTIKKHKKFLKEKYQVKNIGIFGSYSRGEATPKSDVDILVEFSEPLGWEFFDLKEFLEKILDRNVDLVTEHGIREQMKAQILREVVFI